MLRRSALLFLTFAAVTACATAIKPAVRASVASGPNITFTVREAGKLPLVNLPGVTVTGIRTDGSRLEVGRTVDGRITVAKARLRMEQVQLLVFSLRNFHSVAVDLASNTVPAEPSVFEFDEYNIELPIVVVY